MRVFCRPTASAPIRMSADHPPIIIKKRKIIKAAAHHGGAWKVAYADFVTAMMAFFLLMWLLNATTEDQRKGLADYFDPSIPLARISGGGNDAFDGSSIFSDDELSKDGIGSAARYEPVRQDQPSAEQPGGAELEKIEQEILEKRASFDDDELARHIQTRMTPDGLLIELIDQDGSSLFEIGSATASSLLRKLLLVVAPVLSSVENNIEIIGHTDSRAYFDGARYSNWELSAERATAARRLLIESGLGRRQIVAVIGKADVEPIAPDPFASQNRRISLLLRTRAAAPGRAPLINSLNNDQYNLR